MRESQMKFGKRPAEKMRIWDRWKSSDPVELARAGRAGLGLRAVLGPRHAELVSASMARPSHPTPRPMKRQTMDPETSSG